MIFTISVRGAKRAGCWSIVDTVDDGATALNIVRSWFAQGYRVRVDVSAKHST